MYKLFIAPAVVAALTPWFFWRREARARKLMEERLLHKLAQETTRLNSYQQEYIKGQKNLNNSYETWLLGGVPEVQNRGIQPPPLSSSTIPPPVNWKALIDQF